jgi:hypothetical protein
MYLIIICSVLFILFKDDINVVRYSALYMWKEEVCYEEKCYKLPNSEAVLGG